MPSCALIDSVPASSGRLLIGISRYRNCRRDRIHPRAAGMGDTDKEADAAGKSLSFTFAEALPAPVTIKYASFSEMVAATVECGLPRIVVHIRENNKSPSIWR